MSKDLQKVAIYASDKNILYKEMLLRINHFSRTMEETVGEKQETPKILIFSENREGWVYAFFSAWQSHYIVVPVDATATVEDVAYIINDCKPAAAWTSRNNLDTLNKAIMEAGHDMKTLIIDNYERKDIGNSTEGITFAIQALAMPKDGEQNKETALIVYTSGTTGSPKGVMLSYENLYSNIKSVSIDVPIITPERPLIMLLPVHHILPLMASVIVPFTSGSSVAICPSLSAPDIMSTLCRGQVGVFVGVPRLWQTLYNGIKKKIDEKWITRALFSLCEKVNNVKFSHFIFQSIHKKMGGHLDYCVSGGAALDKQVAEGLKTLGFTVLEGYGMTETAPIISFTRPGDVVPGSVGLPLPAMGCKLINGELCAKGVNVMQGYYNRPEETAAVIDKDGYIHTGDLARFDEKGRIYITGRSKEIIVLSNGKNVQPNEIEFKLEHYTDIVKEAAVTQKGDMLCVIIVPQEEWAEGKTPKEQEDLIKEKVLRPYNLTVENYKKLMSLIVFHGDLPRTKLDKLQRFKLKEIVEGKNVTKNNNAASSKKEENLTPEFRIIKKYIENEKKIEVRPQDHIETDLAFDSLDKVSLQGFIEQTFGMTINADTMAAYTSLQAMADVVAQQHTRMEVEEIDWHSILSAETTDNKSLPTAAPTLKWMSSISRSFFKTYNRMSIKGVENVPTKGPFILAPNHQSYLDGPIVMAGLDNDTLKDCYFYATEEHVKGALVKYLANHNNVIVMERQNLKNSILRLSSVLRQGKNIVIFPEGTRTHTGEMGEFKKTFAILAKELNVPIIPVRITGAFRMLKRGSRFVRPCFIQVEYLPKVVANDSLTYDEIAEIVKKRIAGN